MKKTLLLTIDFPPQKGGVANYWKNLAEQMPSDKFFVLAQAQAKDQYFDQKQNYKIFRRNLISSKKWFWPKWLPALFHLYKVVKKQNIKQVIVAHVLPMGTVAFIIKKIFKISYIVSVHGQDVAYATRKKSKKLLSGLIFKNAYYLMVNSQYTKNLVQESGFKIKKHLVVYPCPNVKNEKVTDPELEKFKSDNGLLNKKIILTVGRLVKRKGHDQVVKSLNLLKSKLNDFVYLIVGEGPELEKLKALVVELDLEKQVKFFQNIEDTDLPLFYWTAEVFVMPSRKLDSGDVEGFGIVYLEANLFGLPVIAGKSGGAVEAVENNVNGLVVDPLNGQEIYQALFKLLTDDSRAEELGEKGKFRAEQLFSWSK